MGQQCFEGLTIKYYDSVTAALPYYFYKICPQHYSGIKKRSIIISFLAYIPSFLRPDVFTPIPPRARFNRLTDPEETDEQTQVLGSISHYAQSPIRFREVAYLC